MDTDTGFCELIGYGAFDSQVKFPGLKKTTGRDLLFYELEYYLTSGGKSVVDGVAYNISKGAVLCAKPGQRRSSVLPFQCFFLRFRLPDGSKYISLLNATPDFYRIIDRERYGRIFEELIRHLIGTDPKSPDYVNAKMTELFYYLGKDAAENRKYLSFASGSQGALLPQAIERMQSEYQKKLTLADLAAGSGYSPNYFHHVFTSVMGKTPQKYLTCVRVEQAKRLLIGTGTPLSEIAYACGFSSQAYFTEQFRAETGLTPGAYRKRYAERYRSDE